MSSPRFRPSTGLTLIELAVVVALLAVIAMLAWPSLHTFVGSQRLDGAAGALARDLHFARTEAVLRQQGVRLSVLAESDGGHCYVVHTGAAASCACAHGCGHDALLLRQVRFPASSPVQLQGPTASLHFDPQLGTCTPAGTLRLTDASGAAVHQVVNVMGRVRTCSPDARGGRHATC